MQDLGKEPTAMAESGGDELSLHDVAEHLGVHYMTAYRYVRTGQLPARRDGGGWRVRRGDLEAFARPDTRPRGTRGKPQWKQHVDRLRDRLVTGDEAGAWQVVERALVGGAEPAELYVRILAPALRDVGDRWAQGRFTVEDEHRATTVATRVIGRMGPRFARPGRHRGTVVVGAVPGDSHALPVAMLADVLRGERYEVVDLGGSTPLESFVSAASRADDLVAIGLSTSTAEGLAEAPSVVKALRAELPGVPVLLGGPAVGDEASARRAGADAWAPDAIKAVAALDQLG
jgi:excisionase family DNA binding protein